MTSSSPLSTEKDMAAFIAVARRAGLVRNVKSSGGSACTGSLSGALARPTSLLAGGASTAPLPGHCCRSISGSPHRQQGGGGWMCPMFGVRLPLAGEELASPSVGRRSGSSRSCSSSSGPTKPLLKPMRSVLYTPGSSRHLYKIRDIACDASLIDLEVRETSRWVSPSRPKETSFLVKVLQCVRFFSLS